MIVKIKTFFFTFSIESFLYFIHLLLFCKQSYLRKDAEWNHYEDVYNKSIRNTCYRFFSKKANRKTAFIRLMCLQYQLDRLGLSLGESRWKMFAWGFFFSSFFLRERCRDVRAVISIILAITIVRQQDPDCKYTKKLWASTVVCFQKHKKGNKHRGSNNHNDYHIFPVNTGILRHMITVIH